MGDDNNRGPTLSGSSGEMYQITFTANTTNLYNLCTMVVQRRADVVQMVYKCFVFVRFYIIPYSKNVNYCSIYVLVLAPSYYYILHMPYVA